MHLRGILLAILIVGCIADSVLGKGLGSFLNWNARNASEAENMIHHECIHDHLATHQNNKLHSFLKNNPISEFSKDHESNITKQTSSYVNMRFYLDESRISSGSDPRACYSAGTNVKMYSYSSGRDTTYRCTSSDVVTTSDLDLLKNQILPALTEVFSQVIQVPSSSSNFKLDSNTWSAFNQQCDYDVPIPQSYVTVGLPNTDYVLFVTTRPAESSSVVAYAAACNFPVLDNAGHYGRPRAGYINFAPRYLHNMNDGYTSFQFQSRVKIAVHELSHALGFSNTFYNSYKSVTGTFYNQPVISETRSGTSPAGNSFSVNIKKLATPNLVSYAKSHFGCTSINGVELEDGGGSGTAGSHWESRVAGDEYMTGYVNPSMPVSGLTLSLFSDMGWYQVDKSKAEYYGWGKDLGCGFVQSRCEVSWPNSPGYWCSSGSSISNACTGDRKGKGSCSVSSISGLQPYYQHFSNGNQGGQNQAADRCPYTKASSYFCSDPSLQNRANSGLKEFYGESSACFTVNKSGKKPICYEYNCVSATSLQVIIGSSSITCPTTGGTISASVLGNGATVDCPPASLLCRSVNGFSVGTTLIKKNGTREHSAGSSLADAICMPLIVLLIAVITLVCWDL